MSAECDFCGEPAYRHHGTEDFICERCDDAQAAEAEMRMDALADEADRRRKISKGE